MTLNALLTFMVLSQIAVSAYLLYSFNTIERANKKRHDALTQHFDEAIAELEGRLTGTARPRTRAPSAESSIAGGREAELLHPREA